MKDKDASRRIHILRDTVSQRIAAGEVIDRPFSVVRELMDNAIDAGAQRIDLSIENGGLKKIRLRDDGLGMSREDLELCTLPHATSKIEDAEDIYRLSTLGFRGEALASIAACAHLTITSATAPGEAHVLEIQEGEKKRLTGGPGSRGTVVEAEDIFFSMPGRRKFLKRAGAETSACKKTFIEKTLPYPDLTFSFQKDGDLELKLNPASPARRVAEAHPGLLQPDFLHEIEEEAGDFSFSAVLSSPSFVRKDRRYIHIYVNGRRIQEFSLVQAVEYAYRTVLPGGSHPAAFLFLSINPELVDFNIHPAKREAKIKNLSSIHHEVVQRISRFLQHSGFHSPGGGYDASLGPSSAEEAVQGYFPRFAAGSRFSFGGNPAFAPVDIPAMREIGRNATLPTQSRDQENAVAEREKGEPDTGQFIYRGQVYGVFLIVETEKELLLIDQHAAHERIIYDRLLASSTRRQPLLLPHPFDIEEEEEKLLERRLTEYESLSISVKKERSGRWLLTAVPENCTGMEAEIVDFLISPQKTEESMQAALYADIACKRAVKEGERLDPVSAEKLIEDTLALPVPRCPHGRPVWISLSEEELYRRVGRG